MTTENETHKRPLHLLISRLRAVVLALGESASPAWWKTEFMNESLETELYRMPPDPADDFFPTLRNAMGRPEVTSTRKGV